ncbi:MAG: hypothetical protein NZ740_06345 [Kiritimatiellae bacterium]|nr:hypothetical protein [Kiritimatiellia bacterium]MDW8458715.1 hypothetical protein [Verrucomicrobiota bacterium]
MQKFFQVLKEKNPEEYERLRHLRETNPAEFRAEMAEKIREHRRRHVPDRPESPDTEARAHPKPHRERLAMRPDGRPPALDRFGSPELQALEERAKDLAAAIRSREPGPEREALLKELKEVLEKAFDLRDELRRDQLRRAREELDRMEKRLDERLTRRTAIIQRRMTELTEPGADAW